MSSVSVNASAMLMQGRNGRSESPFSSFSPNSFMTAIPLDPRIASGSVGSIVSAVVTTPFEVAKIKLQSHQPIVAVQGAMATSTLYTTTTRTRQPTGAFSMLRHVFATEGVRGAFAGLAPTMIMSIPNCLLYLISYDVIVQGLKKHAAENTTTGSFFLSETSIPLAGGSLARLIATTATAPLELMRTRHAQPQNITNINNNKNQSMGRVWSELSNIVRNDGFPALYRGMTPQLVRDVPFAAIYMLFLERFRNYTKPILLTQQHQQGRSSSSSSRRKEEMGLEFVNAGIAGMIAATLTAPADVVKSKVQSTSFSSSTTNMKTNNKLPSMMQTASSIVQQEGISGLWRGNQARMLKVAPQYAIMISCYEVGKNIMSPTEE